MARIVLNHARQLSVAIRMPAWYTWQGFTLNYAIHKSKEADKAAMATIKDVAKAAGVTPTTVSNVIHGNERRVSPQKVEVIRRAIEELGYIPNLSARALVNSASHIIGVINHIVPQESGGFFQDPFSGALLTGIEQALSRSDYYLMVRTVRSTSELLSLLGNWHIDGLIFIGVFPQEFYQAIKRTKTAYLLIDSYIDDPQPMQLRLEDERGGYLAARHLIDMGHQSILFISPKAEDEGVILKRRAGFMRALGESGLEHPQVNDYVCEFELDEARALGQRLAQRRDFTAIFATADILAAGIVSGLQSAGRRVPEDISVVGFDDLPVARLCTPQLTTIHQDIVARGECAASMLVASLDGQRPENCVFPVRLVERQSVRRLRADKRSGG